MCFVGCVAVGNTEVKKWDPGSRSRPEKKNLCKKNRDRNRKPVKGTFMGKKTHPLNAFFLF